MSFSHFLPAQTFLSPPSVASVQSAGAEVLAILSTRPSLLRISLCFIGSFHSSLTPSSAGEYGGGGGVVWAWRGVKDRGGFLRLVNWEMRWVLFTICVKDPKTPKS